MKFIMTACLLLIMTFSIPTVFSYPKYRARLYDMLRKPLGTKANSIEPVTQDHNGLSNYQSGSTEYEEHTQTRDTWDSGEDYYFQWANQNRRPVEYLTGRKREAVKVAISPRDRRINGGLWRSGLVG